MSNRNGSNSFDAVQAALEAAGIEVTIFEQDESATVLEFCECDHCYGHARSYPLREMMFASPDKGRVFTLREHVEERIYGNEELEEEPRDVTGVRFGQFLP